MKVVPVAYPQQLFQGEINKNCLQNAKIAKFIRYIRKSTSKAFEVRRTLPSWLPKIFSPFIVFQIHSYFSFISFASPSTFSSMAAACEGSRDLSLLDHCCQLPLQAWFTSIRNGLLPNRYRFTDFKQLRTGSWKSFHRFTQPLLAHQITKVFISEQCEMS